MRLHLRAATPSDADAVASWLPEAAAAIDGRGAPVDRYLTLDSLLRCWDARFLPGATLLAERADGAVVGLARVRTPEDAGLVIDTLAVRADARNRGYGLEMVLAIETTFGEASTRAYAGIPRENGLAVYFWLRAGYRPLYPVPAGPPPGLDPALLWMVRSLTRAAPAIPCSAGSAPPAGRPSPAGSSSTGPSARR
jgi:GNAT superfamily N-acetyltransferase